MKIDITLKITPQMTRDALASERKELAGHLGTHFDVMDREFPLEYTRRKGIVFDVGDVQEIGTEDVDMTKVEKEMFVAFCTDYIERVPYGSDGYFSGHPQLSHELIDVLVEKGVSIIALDFGGVRRGKEHTPKDQYCADHGVFVVENLCGLRKILKRSSTFIAHTYPMNFTELTGLPCRVLAEIEV